MAALSPSSPNESKTSNTTSNIMDKNPADSSAAAEENSVSQSQSEETAQKPLKESKDMKEPAEEVAQAVNPSTCTNTGSASTCAFDEEEDASAAIVASLPLNYANTKSSPYFKNAKVHLTNGDFELALATIESGLTTILSLLPDSDELHESLAPLYYLYGTTLLYSVEESPDNPESSVMAQQVGGEADGVAGDLQISWENLESARSILSRITSSSSYTTVEGKERLLDLAQIHLRLGDLSRHNGHYPNAITDYEKCCEIRRVILGTWDRKVADTEYSLGMTSLLLAAEGEKNIEDGKEGSRPAVGEDNENDDNKVVLSLAQIDEYREKSMCHYLECGRIFGGIIGKLCGEKSDDIGAIVKKNGAGGHASDDEDDDEDDDDCLSGTNGKGKSSTSVSNVPTNTGLTTNAKASVALKAIRQRVSTLQALKKEDQDMVLDMKEMLDEIQETIDNSEDDRAGLKDVNAMKKKAEADILAADKAAFTSEGLATTKNECDETFEQKGKDKGTTTIGFGTAGTVTSNNVATLNNSSSTAEKKVAEVPMMVVKKKKRMTCTNATEEKAKRVKSE